MLIAGTAAAAATALPLRAFADDLPVLDWWDVFGTLTDVHQEIWDAFAAEGKARVVYTHTNPASAMQSLQLAFRSGELPDVYDMGGDPAQLAALYEAGWFAPMDGLVFDKPFQKDTLVEGQTVFDGKQCSLPIFSNLWHNDNLWYHAEAMSAAGGDVEAGVASWEDMRAIAAKATTGGKYGLLLPLQFTTRMADMVIDMAMAAGAPGIFDPKTGEYAYASEPFVETIAFLMSFQKDGSLHPASSSLDARQGRSRWAAGEALFFFDGPWNSGVLASSAPEVLDSSGVSNVPTPGGVPPIIGRGVQPGSFYMSGQSEHPELVVELLQNLTTDDYYVAIAEGMDQPPLDLSAVERANVHPTYKTVVNNFSTTMVRLPDPLVANPSTAQVFSRMRTIEPGLGEIIQGAFAGAFSDVKPYLQQYNDAMTAERERAISAAKADGFDVSADDWVFPNWVRGENYTG
ncbi:hypothetical protein TM49_15795 [Martelella endophytica]|uniref:sn-glycerol-3-phosphate-binding periplasmic protein UgpB n=1 Tax=Martelella endophytica TaxID=1486262 RepID=A0A0D5LRM9_MAREN|nr:hypothetical protein TM49_15795 [Martelella endophytica]